MVETFAGVGPEIRPSIQGIEEGGIAMRIGHASRILLVGAALLPAVQALAAVDAFLTITGTKQGSIKGEAAKEGGSMGSIAVSAVMHEATPMGAMTGKRQHSPITITKEVDQASPLLFQAMTTHEMLSNVTIVFAGSGSGAGKVAQKIVLTDATITNIRKVGNSEQITFDYPTIEVTWVSGGKTATDDWLAQ
jgi:type VI secretion system secreted protein Hcp